MLRRQPLFQATDRQLISSGLQPDLHPSQALLWEVAQNVQFYGGKVRRRKPGSLVNNFLSGFTRGVAQQRLSAGTRTLWMAVMLSSTVMRVYSFDGVSTTLIGDFTGITLDDTVTNRASYPDFTPYGDWMIINGLSTKAHVWKPGTGMVVPADFPDNAQVYRRKLSHLLAFGVGTRGTGIEWSDADNIEVFTPSASNLAGGLTMDEFDTRIMAAVPLGNGIAVYAEDQMGMVSYVGEPFVFGQRMLLDGIGAVSKNAVVSDPSGNFGVGRGGVWWTDGNSMRYIDEGWLRDYLQDNVNWTQKSKIYAARNDYRGTIEFSFPMGVASENNEGWAFDPRTGGWSKVPSFQAMDERRLLEKPIIGDQGSMYMIDDNAGAAGALTLETKPLLMQVQDATGLRDVHTDSRVDELDLLIKNASNVEVAVGVGDALGDAFTWTNWMTVTGQSTTYRLEHLPSGVYWKVRFRSVGTNWDLDLQGFSLFGQVEGTKRGGVN